MKREKRRRDEMKREEEIVTNITAKAQFLAFFDNYLTDIDSYPLL